MAVKLREQAKRPLGLSLSIHQMGLGAFAMAGCQLAWEGPGLWREGGSSGWRRQEDEARSLAWNLRSREASPDLMPAPAPSRGVGGAGSRTPQPPLCVLVWADFLTSAGSVASPPGLHQLLPRPVAHPHPQLLVSSC